MPHVVIVDEKDVNKAVSILNTFDYNPQVIGEVISGNGVEIV